MKKLVLFQLLFLIPIALWAQHSISGQVLDPNGQPITGATVVIKNTYLGTFTDGSGNYSLNKLPEDTYEVEARFIGFGTKTQTVELTGDQTLVFNLEIAPFVTDEVVISATRANNKTPIAYNNLTQEQIEENNVGLDMPYILEQTPSAVVTSDAGTGIGYTGIRIRGTDPSRINVTINGIPLNDAESQGVFWVNMPDFAGSTENIQVQRGVGTSTNGAGAFGGTINLQTTSLREEAYGELNNSIGSFNTLRNSAQFGTGLINGHFTVDGRLSRIESDGFIDRATADMNSYFVSGAYTSKRASIRANVFSGHEVTYQAWDGVPQEILDTNRTFNGTGTDGGALNPAYDNEVDNYRQTHYQLLGTYNVGKNWTANTALHYTRGQGYFEQYKVGEDLADYGLEPVALGSDTVTSTDLIRRRWLDNDFYGLTFSLNYLGTDRLQFIFGGGANRYEGRHFGEVIWAQYASNGSIRHIYYDNDATKTDAHAYAKANYQLTNRLNGFADVQVRSVNYEFLGFDNAGNNVTQSDDLLFVNPKVGLSYEINSKSQAYASYSVGNKEPNRNDYTESSPTSRPKHETLYDLEVGYRYNGRTSAFNANFYRMDYQNQLVLTGEINDVGAATRTNIDNSYRMGLELQWGLKILKWLDWQANFTASDNRISSFTEYMDNWDTGEQIVTTYSNTHLAFSPNLIMGSIVNFQLLERENDEGQKHNLKLSLIEKYVGKQYIDNTSSEDRKLDPYAVTDLRLTYSVTNVLFKEVMVNFLARNVLDNEYEANAWVYRYRFLDEDQALTGFFPQAGRNFMLGLNLKF